MQVFERIGQVGMAHEPLDHQEVGSTLKVVCGKAMAGSVRSVGLFDVWGMVTRLLAYFAYGGNTKVRAFSTGTLAPVE